MLLPSARKVIGALALSSTYTLRMSSANLSSAAPASAAACTGAEVHPRVSLGAGCYWGTEKYVCVCICLYMRVCVSLTHTNLSIHSSPPSTHPQVREEDLQRKARRWLCEVSFCWLHAPIFLCPPRPVLPPGVQWPHWVRGGARRGVG